MKKLLPILLSFLVFTSLKANYFTAPTIEGVVLTYTVDSSVEPYTVMVAECEYNAVEVTIPSFVEYNNHNYTVTSIGGYSFSNCSELIKVTIPETVTSIGYGAFEGCSGLTSITIPESVSSIGRGAFHDTSWYYNQPEGIVYIGNVLYDYIGEMPPNTAVEVQEGTVGIGDNAFSSCSGLTSITIPESVTNIGSGAFSYCSGLTSITIPESVTSIGYSAFSSSSGLTSITIPKSVTRIESHSFSYCENLQSFICEGPIEIFEEKALEGCKSLEIIEAPANSLDFYHGFDYSYEEIIPIRSIKITNGELTDDHFENLRFSRGTVQHLDMSNASNTTVPAMALENLYKLESAVLPKNLKEVPYKFMAECVRLQAIDILASVIKIDDRAFEDCRSLGTVVFDSGAENPSLANLNNIGNWAFYNCHNLTELTIPEGVTEIGLAAFYGCSYLEKLSLPSTVGSIGDNSFAKCSKLKSIRVNAETPPFIAAKTFNDVSRQIPVSVPVNSNNYYATDIYWSEFVNIYESDNLTPINKNGLDGHKVYTNKNQITVENPALLSVRVYDVNGRIINNSFSSLRSKEINISVPKGIYIVLIGNESVKVVM